MTTMTMVDAIRTTLTSEMERDERVVVLGQDVGVSGGVFRATEGLLERFGSERVVDTPLAEAAIVGASIGLAVAGLVPVAELQFLGFAQQAMHQLGGQLARLRQRTQGRFEAPVTLRAPFGGGVRAPELHSDALDGILAHFPGLKLVAPATAADAKGLLTAAIRDPDPVIFLEPLRGYRGIRDDVADGDYITDIGKAREVRSGGDVTIIGWSYMATIAARAAERVEAEDGASVGVLDLRSLVPLDVDALVRAAEGTGRIVVVDEAALTGGFAGEIVATIQEEAFYSLEAPIVRVCGYDIPYPGLLAEDWYVPDEDRVVAAVRRVLHAR